MKLIRISPISILLAFSCNHGPDVVMASDISLVDFQGLLYSEVNGECSQRPSGRDRGMNNDQDADSRIRGRFLREEDVTDEANALWDNIVKHGWSLSESLQSSSNKIYSSSSLDRRRSQRRNLKVTSKESTPSAYFPFLVCSKSSTKMSAFRRLGPMLNSTDALFRDAIVVRNDPLQTCYHVSMQYGDAKQIRDSIEAEKNVDHDLSLVPMTDLMKIQLDTMSMIYEDAWSVPKNSSPDDWERLVRVGLSVGHRMTLDADEVTLIAKDIIQDIRSLNANQKSSHQRRHLRNKNIIRNKRGPTTEEMFSSVSDAFSLTASSRLSTDEEEVRQLLGKKSNNDTSTTNRWERALKEGLEDDHSCQAMFDTLAFNTHYNNQGFDIILNPATATTHTNNHDHSDGIEKTALSCEHEHRCTASNTHCVASLIIALSTHPLVLSIETEGPVIADDYESQWITQTKTEGNRPLRDIGINGENQIISIIDSGLDINHKYFGPTSTNVFNQWDYSQRKVVRYDHSIGDKTEPKGGHGTKVAGAAVGRCRDNENDAANGIAEAAKLHIFDIQKGSGGYKMPSAFTLLESMHSTDDRPARVANGSWNTRYRAYPFSCRWFDEALHGKYQGDLYVASAGNEGLHDTTLKSRGRTIGNPASCKNTLAVGANQSHGDRIAKGAHGVDYLAAFSSRGPTFDGRMKPDVVAPGASVLTAYAHESGKTVEAYGTSFSGPVVAGNAALVRQYFEDGKLPCTSATCAFDPSGSLVKAVLMNSATPLKQVQVSRPWMEKNTLEEITEYDHNQGMGLIQLDKTLPIKGHNKINAVVRNNEEIDDDQYHDIFIRANPGKCINKPYRRDFSATLVWYDPAGTSSCAKCLMNDLDITVQRVNAKGKVISGSGIIFPNGANRKDYDNNAERIRFKMKGHQRYRIRIKADNLVSAKTKYSMIATGCFKILTDPSEKV